MDFFSFLFKFFWGYRLFRRLSFWRFFLFPPLFAMERERNKAFGRYIYDS